MKDMADITWPCPDGIAVPRDEILLNLGYWTDWNRRRLMRAELDALAKREAELLAGLSSIAARRCRLEESLYGPSPVF